MADNTNNFLLFKRLKCSGKKEDDYIPITMTGIETFNFTLIRVRFLHSCIDVYYVKHFASETKIQLLITVTATEIPPFFRIYLQ